MRHLVLLCCILATANAERQVQLEDIEKDNLASERRGQVDPNLSGKEPDPYVTPPKPPTTLELQYGFRPMHQQPQQVHTGQPQYFPPQDSLPATPPQQYSLPQYYLSYQNLASQLNKQSQHLNLQRQPPYLQPQSQYQLTLPYIADNHIPQEPQNYQQRYYVPQYVYLQQYPAASTNIHAVVDPKGGIQYVMYIPAHLLQDNKEQQSDTLETIIKSQPVYNQQQYFPEDLINKGQQPLNTQQQYVPQYLTDKGQQLLFNQQLYVAPDLSNKAQQNEPQYVPPDLSDKGQQYQYLENSAQPEPVNYPQIQYVAQPSLPKSPKYQLVPQKYEPKSLLDSYVPSILQVQYYKQQQAEQLQVTHPPSTTVPQYKSPQNTEYVKNYSPRPLDTEVHNLQYLKPPQKS